MNARQTRVLVLGAGGMLGWTASRLLHEDSAISVTAAVRDRRALPEGLARLLGDRLIQLDVTKEPERRRVIAAAAPDFVLNCVGVIKQDPRVNDRVSTVWINSLLPHLLANDCDEVGARLIQVSTDCVFSGRTGRYTEVDVPDPVDFYGRTKLVGELNGRHLTLRTSIIGPEVQRRASLVEWFLAQEGMVVKGFRQAIYSGVTTVEFTRFLRGVVLPNPDLSGLYQLASEPISKYDLLKMVADEYGWEGRLAPDDEFACDRSLSGELLRKATGYQPPPWREMIRSMAADQRSATHLIGGSRP